LRFFFRDEFCEDFKIFQKLLDLFAHHHATWVSRVEAWIASAGKPYHALFERIRKEFKVNKV
jgi:hypothetical protein